MCQYIGKFVHKIIATMTEMASDGHPIYFQVKVHQFEALSGCLFPPELGALSHNLGWSQGSSFLPCFCLCGGFHPLASIMAVLAAFWDEQSPNCGKWWLHG
jgi:hypothetical protein